MPFQCPKCGSENIKEVEDKSKVLSYANHQPIYATVKVCRECGHRFSE
jgi:C4-type Zn-finger protein